MLIIDDRFLIRTKNKHHRQFLDKLAPYGEFEFVPFTVDPVVEDAHFSKHYLPRDTNKWVVDSEPFISFLTDILNDHGMTFEGMYRCAYNITFNNGIEKSPTHLDHTFEHYQMLVYLNDAEGETVTEEGSIPPKKYRCVIFDSQRHHHFFPKKGHRMVLVFTFSSKFLSETG